MVSAVGIVVEFVLACQYLTLSPLERSYYDKRHSEVKKSVRNLSPHAAALTPSVLANLTALRQICCHPQIVRRDDGLLGDHGQRLSMEEIVGRCVRVRAIVCACLFQLAAYCSQIGRSSDGRAGLRET